MLKKKNRIVESIQEMAQTWRSLHVVMEVTEVKIIGQDKMQENQWRAKRVADGRMKSIGNVASVLAKRDYAGVAR